MNNFWLICFTTLLVGGFAFAADISACGAVTESSILTAPLTNNTTCLNITAPNVILDCAGYTITLNVTTNTSYASAIYSDQANTTIKNCNIVGPVANNSYGIKTYSAANSTVTNCNVTGFQYGIWFNRVNMASLAYSKINRTTISSIGQAPIFISNSNKVNLSYISAGTTGANTLPITSSARGVRITNSNNTYISHSNQTSISQDTYWLVTYPAKNLTLYNVTLNTTSNGIYLYGTGTFSIRNSYI
ncbi:MAG: right-handed parallel beta-helix repeat-containing protein [Candidatus Micrarchaeia archaeon]